MTLEEAIEHHEQIADSYNNTVPDCDCAKKQRQLAGWLKELKYYREECNTFKVKGIIKSLEPIKTVKGIVRVVENQRKYLNKGNSK